MKISKDKVVEFIYELEVDGNIVDHTTKERPLDYIHGTQGILPKLEAHIEGMEAGDKFTVTLAPEDAYGQVDPNKIIDLPKTAFEVNGQIREDLLVPGTRIPMMNSMGAVIPGVVLEVTENTVKMDLNSEMAGKTLHFTGEIISVREATEKELAEGCPLTILVKHLFGLFAGIPGGKKFRQILSEGASNSGAGIELVKKAMAEVSEV